MVVAMAGQSENLMVDNLAVWWDALMADMSVGSMVGRWVYCSADYWVEKSV